MKKDANYLYWISGFILASLGVCLFLFYIYEFKPANYHLPEFSWIEIALTFTLGFFPSVISRIVANIKTGQVTHDMRGVVESFRDAVWGWLVYYILFILCFVLYDWIVWGTLPSLWGLPI